MIAIMERLVVAFWQKCPSNWIFTTFKCTGRRGENRYRNSQRWGERPVLRLWKYEHSFLSQPYQITGFDFTQTQEQISLSRKAA